MQIENLRASFKSYYLKDSKFFKPSNPEEKPTLENKGKYIVYVYRLFGSKESIQQFLKDMTEKLGKEPATEGPTPLFHTRYCMGKTAEIYRNKEGVWKEDKTQQIIQEETFRKLGINWKEALAAQFAKNFLDQTMVQQSLPAMEIIDVDPIALTEHEESGDDLEQ